MTRRKIAALLLVIALISAPSGVLAQAESLSFEEIPAGFRPGKTVKISFHSPRAGETRLLAEDKEGRLVGTAIDGIQSREGHNDVFWDGELLEGEGGLLPAGDYYLVLEQGVEKVREPFTAGALSPRLSEVTLSDSVLTAGNEEWAISAFASMAGKLHVTVTGADGLKRPILTADVPAGSLLIPWDGLLYDGLPEPSGVVTLSLTLEEEGGFLSNPHHLIVTVEGSGSGAAQGAGDEPAAPVVTEETAQPHEASPEPVTVKEPEPEPDHYKVPTGEDVPAADRGSSYWKLPVGEWDEERIWQVLMQPITVLEGGDQRETYKLRKTPDKDSSRDNIVGEITFVSHGVHVIETLDSGWSLVETYNSSYGPNNRTRRGYGETMSSCGVTWKQAPSKPSPRAMITASSLIN